MEGYQRKKSKIVNQVPKDIITMVGKVNAVDIDAILILIFFLVLISDANNVYFVAVTVKILSVSAEISLLRVIFLPDNANSFWFSLVFVHRYPSHRIVIKLNFIFWMLVTATQLLPYCCLGVCDSVYYFSTISVSVEAPIVFILLMIHLVFHKAQAMNIPNIAPAIRVFLALARVGRTGKGAEGLLATR